MNNIRIIPRLDIKGPNLVKGIHLEGLRVLGKPEDFAELYYKSGADELMFVDVVASLYERNSLHNIITRTAEKIFIPLTVSGGLRSLKDIKRVLRAGADKVSLNTAVLKNPELIKQASREFGSSTIVVTIEAIKQPNMQYYAYTDNGREFTGINVVEWAKKAEDFGAGEIVITSVDKEGTGKGFDTDLINMVSEVVNIPVIAHGGPGNITHLKEAVQQGGANAICVASILHYGAITKIVEKRSFHEEGNIEFLKKGRGLSKISTMSIPEIKKELHNEGIPCRYEFQN